MKQSRIGPLRNILLSVAAGWWVAICLLIYCIPSICSADVPTGDAQTSTNYYRGISKSLEFATPDSIFQTKIDDVATYFGYSGFTGTDFQDVPSDLLMNPNQTLLMTNVLQNPGAILAARGTPFGENDILVTRFFAPKIMNINDAEPVRQLGWRKLVRLNARPGSMAQKHSINSGIILFNFFTDPGVQPFNKGNESVNTQVILVTDVAKVPAPNADGPPSVYWLDYGTLSSGGQLSMQLNAFFDANQLPQSLHGKRGYFVPDGCVACHGANIQYPLVNYLDTDHWFDRLDNDFTSLKASGIPLLFDGGSNDSTSPSFRHAFDVIHKFNQEADTEVSTAQPTHDEALASHKWLEIHAANYEHLPPAARAIGKDPKWSQQNSNDVQVLAALNQYCFRCHGTVKFSVFNREEIQQPLYQALMAVSLNTNSPPLQQMPPDRPLPDETRKLLFQFLQ